MIFTHRIMTILSLMFIQKVIRNETFKAPTIGDQRLGWGLTHQKVMRAQKKIELPDINDGMKGWNTIW